MGTPDNELLSAFHDGDVIPAERAIVQQRLTTSAAARRELSEIEQVSALLKELPHESLPPEFPQQVLQAIEREMLIPTDRDDPASVFPKRSRARWIGAAAVLTSAAGLLLLVRAVDDRAGRGFPNDRHLAGSPRFQSAPAEVAADSPMSARGAMGGFGEGTVPSPLAADAAVSVERKSDVALGAAGQNSVVANSPMSTLSRLRMAGANAEPLFFDQSTLRNAEIGDVVQFLRTEGNEVAVVWLTVVDRQQGLEGLQLLLANNHIAQSEKESLTQADRLSSPASAADQMHAVLVESDAKQLTAALKQLREQTYVQSLEVDQPIQLAQLEEARAGRALPVDQPVDGDAKREVAKSLPDLPSSSRRAKSAPPEASAKKTVTTAPASADKPSSTPTKANESRDAKDQLAKQVTFELSSQVLAQNQSGPQSRSRGSAPTASRGLAAPLKNAEAEAEHRPLQVLFVVVDQSQAAKQAPPSNSSRPPVPAKARNKPAKPADQDGAS